MKQHVNWDIYDLTSEVTFSVHFRYYFEYYFEVIGSRNLILASHTSLLKIVSFNNFPLSLTFNVNRIAYALKFRHQSSFRCHESLNIQYHFTSTIQLINVLQRCHFTKYLNEFPRKFQRVVFEKRTLNKYATISGCNIHISLNT